MENEKKSLLNTTCRVVAAATITVFCWTSSVIAGPGMPGPQIGGFPLPGAHETIRMGKDLYRFSHGLFYLPGPGGFAKVKPPRGLIVGQLPIGFETLVVAGITYFVFAGIYYQQASGGYVVVDPPPEHPPEAVPTGEMLVIDTEILNVRSGPDANNPVVSQVKKGMQFEVLGSTPGWRYIQTPGGSYGWVMDKYTHPIEPTAKG